ncbi:amino acid ABC transporter permease [Butyrivibrio sp. WCE2006]|uniref:amino acid ABC transporter permease n=1 Tax=Butyrivibrio sp. WCE2006 TaxID=1410611 RepID=UPI0005D2BE26|nr:amino acid ABC transporter permease [Butyrivibrio sp. WCE2006]
MNFFSWERFIEAWTWIIPYIPITLKFVIVCVLASTIFAIVIAAVRIKNIPIARNILGLYVSYMRGTPFLVQLMVVYYGVPVIVNSLFGVNISRWDGFIFAEIAMVMNEAAFLGETIRGAILAVPTTQTEAGYSIGMTGIQTFFRIVLPQAVKTLIPAYSTTLVGILQSSSMLYTIGVIEIVARARTIGAKTSHMFEGYAVCGIIYIVFSLLIKFASGKLEKRMNYGRGVNAV